MILEFIAKWTKRDASLLTPYFSKNEPAYINIPRPSAYGYDNVEALISGFLKMFQLDIYVSDITSSSDGNKIWTERIDYFTMDGNDSACASLWIS